MSLDGVTVGLGVVTIAIGTLIRCLVSFVVVMGRDLTVKERIFVALSKIPKATVQVYFHKKLIDVRLIYEIIVKLYDVKLFIFHNLHYFKSYINETILIYRLLSDQLLWTTHENTQLELTMLNNTNC